MHQSPRRSLPALGAALILNLLAGALSSAVADGGRKAPIIPPQAEREQLLMNKPDWRHVAAPKSASAMAAQDEYDALSYFLNLDFNDSTELVSGSVTIEVRSMVPLLETVVLDMVDELSVFFVTRDGATQAYSHSNDLLRVTLAEPVPLGETVEFVVQYSGSPPNTNYFGWNRFYNGSGSMVWSLSEPEGARTWWPCKDRPDDKAFVEEWWTVRPQWIATGNGVLLGVDTLTSGRKRYRWKPANPQTTYLVSIAAADYETLYDSYSTLAGETMPIEHYVYPGTSADAVASFSTLPAMMEFYAETFGEYPFVAEKYGMSSFPFGGAMEHSTNSSYGYWLIDGTHRYDYVVAHELIHQWFGDSVSPKTWADIWLNEGFASYGEALWAEHLGGSSSLQDYMSSMYRSSFSGTVYDPLALFGSTVYDKGAWVQHMLRHVLGDSAFFESQRDWFANHADGAVNTAEYQAHMESYLGASLQPFFDQWVYGPGQPRYQYGYTTADVGGGVYRHYVRISQTQSGDGIYVMPVDLTLVMGGTAEVHTVQNDQDDQIFVIETAAPLTQLRFDEDYWILKIGADVVALSDEDTDGVPDGVDNCGQTSNANQLDTDLDGLGDACDDDDDGDLLPDADDCAPQDETSGTTGTVDVLVVDAAALEATSLSWTSAAFADDYDLIRGQLESLTEGYGVCVQSVPDLFTTDELLPRSGAAFFYLVRGRDTGCGGPGPLGTDSAGTPRSVSCLP